MEERDTLAGEEGEAVEGGVPPELSPEVQKEVLDRLLLLEERMAYLEGFLHV